MKYGATNTYAFAVQPGSTPSRTGDQPSHSREIRMGVHHNNDQSNFTHLFLNERAGRVALWEYDNNDISPEIWVVRNSSGTPEYVWESESKFHPDRDSAQPFIDENHSRSSLISSGGSIVQIQYPGSTELSSIETDTLAASLPSWISDTNHSSITSLTTLLERLFREGQARVGLSPYGTITEILNRSFPLNDYLLYLHVWLRACAKILYDYRAESIVELVTDKFTVDSDGIVSV